MIDGEAAKKHSKEELEEIIKILQEMFRMSIFGIGSQETAIKYHYAYKTACEVIRGVMEENLP